MQTNKIITATIALIIGLSFCAQGQEREQLTVPVSDPSKEIKLNVNLISGSIKVMGYDGKDVVIDAIAPVSEKKQTRERTDGMKKISTNDGFEIVAREQNNNINVSTDRVNMKINLSIKVPRRSSLKLKTINDGDIYVESVSGNHEISNINGEIKMKNVAGSVVANTINEDIIINFTDITPNTPMAFTTLNGNVDVTFPANVKANVKLKSDMGEVLTDFDIDVDKTAAKIKQTADKEKGLYKIQKDEWTYGKINGGGPEIMMKTMHGNVLIRKVK
ncbi:MAG: hypothetical protein ACOVO2_22390 [Emticicia sp.]|uniref:hypothetical protein n=1 Tax=Emticicia sp. TaxID=1930953 RepID=UPI003BA4A837